MKWKQISELLVISTEGHTVRKCGGEYNCFSPMGYFLGTFEDFARCKEIVDKCSQDVIDWLQAYEDRGIEIDREKYQVEMR